MNMKEVISDNCLALTQFLSASEFHNLVYVSFAVIGLFTAVLLIKTISIFRKSQNFTSELFPNTNYPKKLVFLIDKLNLRGRVFVFKSNKPVAF